MEQPSRDKFGSKFGIIAAAAGSAIGLGNIWRFPYVAGENGGAAFILVYLLIVFLIGLPVLMSEFALGRNTQRNVFGAFKILAPKTKWYIIGVLGIITSFIILSFYNVVAAWTLSFLQESITNSFSGLSTLEISDNFNSMIFSGWIPIIWIAIFIICTLAIVIVGIQKGIEKYNKILMPLLFVILIVLCINSFTLPGFKEATNFLFKPDFSKLNASVILSALGQAFFSLSLGMGTMMTYGSYMSKKDNMLSTASSVALADIAIAILAGIAIFPAVFSFGIEPNSGPDLVFKTLPNVFAQMPGGYFISILFFVLLVVAAITSAVSIFEVIIAFCTEELKISRKKATIFVALAVFLTSSLCAISQMPDSPLMIAGYNLFDLCDKGTSLYLLPLGGLLIVIYTAWIFKDASLKDELSSSGKYKIVYYKYFRFIIKYVAPIMIILVFLSSLGII